MPSYGVKIYKSWRGRSDEGQWSNSYEFSSANAIDSPELKAEVMQLVDILEKPLHSKYAHFMRALVYLLGAQGRLSPPGSFTTIALDGVGTYPLAPADTMVALDVCLAVKHTTAGGRSGRSLYRGCIPEVGVEEIGGKFVLTPGVYPDQLVTAINTWNNLANRIDVGIATRPEGPDSVIRQWTSTQLAGVVVLKRRRRRRKRAAAQATGNPVVDTILSAGTSLLGVAANLLAERALMSLAERSIARGMLSSVAVITPQMLNDLGLDDGTPPPAV